MHVLTDPNTYTSATAGYPTSHASSPQNVALSRPFRFHPSESVLLRAKFLRGHFSALRGKGNTEVEVNEARFRSNH